VPLSKPIDQTHSLSSASREFITSRRANNSSPATISTYRWALDTAEQVLGGESLLSQISGSDIDRLLVSLQTRGLKPSTVNAVWRPLRTLLRWAVAQGYIDRAPTEGRRAPVIPEQERPIPSVDVVRAMVSSCTSRSRHDFLATRDRAIILLLATTGARLAEVTNIQLGDLRLGDSAPHISVLGKGRRVRSLYLDAATEQALVAYLTRARPRSEFKNMNALWLGPRGPMTPSGIAQMVRSRSGGVVHPHMLRRYFASTALDAGISETSVMALAGWTSPRMLRHYTAATAGARARDEFLSAARPVL
jgi:site-specific recombinase XerD